MIRSPARPVAAFDALDSLRDGNRRFVRAVRGLPTCPIRRRELAAGQSPNAIVLSCADSRVPSELVFDCGLGDLFVVRVAGNVCAPSLVGSIEYAASTFGTELVVVMGHTGCGAVKATIDALTKGTAHSPNIADLVSRIAPAVSPLIDQGLTGAALLDAATRENVVASAEELRNDSRVLAERIANGQLMVVGAEYHLESGIVDFFDIPVGRTSVAA